MHCRQRPSPFELQWMDGKIELECVPQGTFAERRRCQCWQVHESPRWPGEGNADYLRADRAEAFLTAMRARSSSRRVCSRSGATALLAARVIDSKLWQSYVAKMQSKRELDVDLHQNPTPIGIGHAIANSAQSIGDALLFGAIVTICRSATRHLPTRSAPGTTFARGGGMRVR